MPRRAVAMRVVLIALLGWTSLRCSRPHTGDEGEACNENLHNLWCNGGLVCEGNTCVVDRHAPPPVTGCFFLSGSGCMDGERSYECTQGQTPTSTPSPPEGRSSTCASQGNSSAERTLYCCHTPDAG